jgi:hypothetical protein
LNELFIVPSRLDHHKDMWRRNYFSVTPERLDWNYWIKRTDVSNNNGALMQLVGSAKESFSRMLIARLWIWDQIGSFWSVFPWRHSLRNFCSLIGCEMSTTLSIIWTRRDW